MSDKYTTFQQHEPLRVPEGWTSQEKRFVAQLEEVLDDLYRRFNRLKLKDLDASLRSTIVESAEGMASLTVDVDGIAGRVEDAEGNITDLQATAQGLSADISDAQGDITSLQATAEGLSADMTNAQGDITTLQATAQGLSTNVASAQGDISALQQTAQLLGASLSDAEGDIATLQATAQGISATVSSQQTAIAGKLGKTEAAAAVENTAVDITASGVKVKTTGFFQVDAGGRVDINGASGSMDLGANSQVSAARGQFTTLAVGNAPFLPVIASQTQPAIRPCFWAQYSTITQANVSFPTRASRTNQSCGFIAPYGTQASPHIFTASASPDVLSGTQFDYEVHIPFYRVMAGAADKDFFVSIVRGGVTATFQQDNYNIVNGIVTDGEFFATGQPNLFTLALAGEPFQLIIYAGPRNSNLEAYVNSNSLIQLTAKATGAAVGATACSLFYIP